MVHDLRLSNADNIDVMSFGQSVKKVSQHIARDQVGQQFTRTANTKHGTIIFFHWQINKPKYYIYRQD